MFELRLMDVKADADTDGGFGWWALCLEPDCGWRSVICEKIPDYAWLRGRDHTLASHLRFVS